MKTTTSNETKLIGNTAYGKQLTESKKYFEEYEDSNFPNYESFKYNLRVKYDNFLSTPLQLGFFIPTSLDGVVLVEPIEDNYNLGDIHAGYFRKDVDEWELAKSRVLFEGFEICRRNSKLDCLVNDDLHLSIKHFDKMTIEDLTKYNLTLTASAKSIIENGK